jgi:hypothetical protein
VRTVGAAKERSRSNALFLDWQKSSRMYERRLENLRAKVKSFVGGLRYPHFTLWKSCSGRPGEGCPLTPGREYVAGVPDTFTYYVNFRSTVPVTVWIMDVHNFVCWETRYCAWRGVGWQNRTSLENGTFHDAEGCAGYFAVFVSDREGTLYPDVQVTRNPAAHPTGACR